MKYFILCLIIISLFLTGNALCATSVKLLNVSYDPTREFYESYNRYFTQVFEQKTGQNVIVEQSHGASGSQARAVIEGLPADVVTLALAYDIDTISQKAHLLPANWQSLLPNNSCPYTSTIVFLVRHGNPKNIRDWSDLKGRNISIITPNPKTSGGARWGYLAAWSFALKKWGSEQAAKNFIAQIYKNVPILDTGARGATNTFVQREIGDVLITWENEAYLVLTKFGRDKFEVIRPSLSISIEPPVAVITQNTDKKGITPIAKAYLETLYSVPAQDLIGRFYFRPSNKVIAAKFGRLFPPMNMITIQDLGGWNAVQAKHFANGGIFDQLYHVGQ